MENQEFKKKLLYYDEAEFTRQMGDFQQNLKILNQIAEKFEELFSGKITQKRINQIFESDFHDLQETAHASIIKKNRNDLLAEVTSELFEKKFTDFVFKVSQMVDRFNKTAVREIYVTQTPLEWYSINSEGRFFIPDATLAEIRERCSNYIDNEQQQHIYDLLEELAKLNNKIYDSLGKRAKAEIDLSSDHRHRVISDLLTSDSAGNTIVDSKNNFQFLAQ